MSIPISFHDSIAAVQHHVVPDIELPSLVKEWSFYVLLKDVGLEGAVVMLLLGLEDGLDLVEVEAYCDSVATIGVLSWLDDPSIELVDRIRIAFIALGNCVVTLKKPHVLFVLQAGLDVEGERQPGKHIDSFVLIVLRHGLEEGFFVADYEVVFEMVMDFDCSSLLQPSFWQSELTASVAQVGFHCPF